MNNDKISTRQAIIALTIFRVALVISYTPSLDLPPANQDIWIVIILSFVYTILLRMPILYIINKFNSISIMEYIEKIMGKLLGKLIVISYGLYFAVYSIYTIVVQTQLIGAVVLPHTPYWLIVSLVLVLSIYLCLKGLVMFYWTSELIGPMNLVAIISLIVLGFKQVEIRLLLPILADSTFLQINKGAFIISLITIDILILVMSVPYLENKKDINKIFFISNICSLILVIITIIVTQGALGIEQAKHSNYPFLIYTRLINYNSVFERIDLFFVVSWLSSNILRIGTYIYLTYMSFNHLFKLKRDKYLIYIINIIIIVCSFYWVTKGFRTTDKSQLNSYLVYSSIIFITLIPLATLIVYFFRRKSINIKKQV